jgi:hypothetical protein
MQMNLKIVIIDSDWETSCSMKMTLEKNGFSCDQFTAVDLSANRNGQVGVYTIHGGVADVPLANYAIALLGKVPPYSVQADAIVSAWKKVGICCIRTISGEHPTLLAAVAESVVSLGQFEGWVTLSLPAIYEQACLESSKSTIHD